jgi:hypothetical protein
MPTILMILGWRFFFYANEGNEPPHIHCKKGSAEGKYWLDAESFEAVEVHAYSMTPADRRTVRRIVFQHFDYILGQWSEFAESKHE